TVESYGQHTTAFPAGSSLLLYTDGLIERRGESIDEGLERLLQAAAGEAETDETTLADRVYGALVGEEALEDDVALLAIESVPLARVPLEVDAANAAQVREELAAATRHEAFELVVDLSRTRFIDSAGLDMLFRLRDSLAHRRATLRVVIPPDSMLQRVAEIVG